MRHEPVLLNEVLEWLKVEEKETFIDATMGLGGHSKAILERNPRARVYGFEWNETSFDYLLEKFKEFGARVKIFNENFVEAPRILKKLNVKADGILMDLGVSSYLIEGSGRGFTFKKDEPLDMRMSFSITTKARDVLNQYSFNQLKRVLETGEVPRAERFAKFLCEFRKQKRFETTYDLVNAVKKFFKTAKPDLLALVFQSIRIEVNKELENLEKTLAEVLDVLNKGARIVVISFHSLEDRIVKNFFRNSKSLKVLTKKPITPSKEEVLRNPRSRSAKMRVAEVV